MMMTNNTSYKDYITDIEALVSRLNKKPADAFKPVSENASQNTKKLFEFLRDNFKKRTLAGQQMLFPDEFEDIVYYRETGDLPAIKGFDFMDETGRHEYYTQVDRAMKWAKQSGGILTFCWHWYVPLDIDDYSKGFNFYSENSSFDLVKAVTVGTKEYEFIIDDIDCIAKCIKRFADENIPILWRPLHESNGAWFWWGKRSDETKEAYKKLWYMIFDRLENFYKLDNLIWVWNGQDKQMLVSPNTFDIVGDDIYLEIPNDHSSQLARYEYMKECAKDKMITLSECRFIPDPNEMEKDDVHWLWWLPWWGIFVYKFDENRCQVLGNDGRPVINEELLPRELLKKSFSDDRVITLGKLPWFDGEKYKYPDYLIK